MRQGPRVKKTYSETVSGGTDQHWLSKLFHWNFFNKVLPTCWRGCSHPVLKSVWDLKQLMHHTESFQRPFHRAPPRRARKVSAVWSTWLSKVCCVPVLSKSLRVVLYPKLRIITADALERWERREIREPLDSSEDTVGSWDSGGEAKGLPTGLLCRGLLTFGSPAEDEGEAGRGSSGISEGLLGLDLSGDMSSAGALLKGGRIIPSSLSPSAALSLSFTFSSSAAISWRMLLSKVRDLVGFFFGNLAVAGLRIECWHCPTFEILETCETSQQNQTLLHTGVLASYKTPAGSLLYNDFMILCFNPIPARFRSEVFDAVLNEFRWWLISWASTEQATRTTGSLLSLAAAATTLGVI